MNNVYNLRIIIRIKEPDFLWILEYNMMITRTLATIINITLKLVAIMIVVLLSAIVTVGSPVVLVTINEQKSN